MRKSGARVGAVEAGTVDLARLLLLEFSLVYGNDFFLIPVDLAVGSVFRVRSLVVQDTFGVRTLIRHSSDSDPPLGRYDWTHVIDLTTGQEQPHVYNGERSACPCGRGPAMRSRGGSRRARPGGGCSGRSSTR